MAAVLLVGLHSVLSLAHRQHSLPRENGLTESPLPAPGLMHSSPASRAPYPGPLPVPPLGSFEADPDPALHCKYFTLYLYDIEAYTSFLENIFPQK